MTPLGETDGWCKSKANQVRIANMFLEHTAEVDPSLAANWGAKWDNVPEEYACSKELFAHLATYLVDTYVIEKGRVNNGKPLSLDVAHAVWGGLIDQLKQRFSTPSAATQVHA
jgi:hypothetical protein